MKVGIVVFPGTNCDLDTKRACEFLGWKASFIWHNETCLDDFNIIFLPGGFSYGDYIAAGRLAKFSPVISSLNNYINNKKGFVVGICNGFQILCEANFLPGALFTNETTKFICQDVILKTNQACVNYLLNSIKLPIAHIQGKYTACEETIKQLKDDNMILFQYKNNINGSDENIAGIYNRKKKIIGLMPHPERAVFKETGNQDGISFFKMLEKEL